MKGWRERERDGGLETNRGQTRQTFTSSDTGTEFTFLNLCSEALVGPGRGGPDEESW